VGESVKAVLFDVDGTLVDTSYLHAVSWWEAFAQAGHDVPMARIHRAIGMGKPAPDLVQVALDKVGLRPSEAMFVGDAVWDAQACQRAGVACVGVLSGGVSQAELLEAGAVRVYRDAAEILASFPASLLDGPQ
jgi:phosphoglycolate phosphatase-like HAD superfamily hydrolase